MRESIGVAAWIRNVSIAGPVADSKALEMTREASLSLDSRIT
jgi:hypothetical protein